MARPVSIIELTTRESQELHRRVQASTTTRRDHLRARIILLRAREMRQQDVAEALGVSIVCVNKWSQRFEREGLEGVAGQTGTGATGDDTAGDGGTGDHAGGAGAARAAALEHADHGVGGRGVSGQRAAHLASARSQTAFAANLQALQ